MGYRHENEPSPPQITPANAGTWLDGALGWHNTYRVIDIAKAYGFTLEPHNENLVDAFRQSEELTYSELDVVHEISAEATDHLQSLAPEGYYFDWDAGELSLVYHGDDEED